MERISKQPVIDVDKYAGRMRYIDSEGYACVADRPKGLSPDEKKERKEARQAERQEMLDERLEAREKVRKARQLAKKEVSAENAEAYEEVLAEYENVMGR